jgi:hypothetical protein
LNLDKNNAVWRKSTRSSNGSQCVEVAPVGDRVAVRDSKHPSGSTLMFSRDSWAAFVAGVSTGEFDRA